MSIEANKENIHRLVDEIYNEGNVGVLHELLAQDYVIHRPEGTMHGPEVFSQFVYQAKTAMPDIHWTIDNMIGEGDYLAVQYTTTGTFTGRWGDVEPTGKSMILKTVIVYRFENGKQVESWPYNDHLTMRRQLGLPIPS